MTVSAFIRSFKGDIHWLKYCLRALMKRGSQFNQIVVCVPDAERYEFLPMLREIDPAMQHSMQIDLRSWEPVVDNGYIDQQVTKCNADLFCRGDFIMHFDSDCIALREIELDQFFVAGRPKLLFRRWEDAGTGAAWRFTTAAILCRDPHFETMASHPFVYHRSTHELFRRHLQSLHRMQFNKIFDRRQQFSEFNAIGNFCHQATPDAYHFVRAGSPKDDFPRPFRQYWSRGELIPEDVEKLL